MTSALKDTPSLRACLCGLAVAALMLIPSSGIAAEDQSLWEGTWTPEVGQCSEPDSDGAPLVVASSKLKEGLYWQSSAAGGEELPSGEHGQLEFLRAADPFVCYITKITSIISLQGWIFDLQCGGEGEIWEARHVVLSGHGGDELAHYDGYRTTILHRCTADDLFAASAFEDGHAAYLAGDYSTALRLLMPIAEQGDADAELYIGFMYSFGYGVTEDDTQAVKWYRLAAEQGNAQAQFVLGSMYSRGDGVTEDDAQAVKWHRLAAEQGNARAQISLAYRYTHGKGVRQDFAEASKLYRMVAEHGDKADRLNAAWGMEQLEALSAKQVDADRQAPAPKQAGIAGAKPANWPQGHVVFDCELPNGTRERVMQAFLDDVGGNTWNKYLVFGNSPEELQARFMAGRVATLDPGTNEWGMTIPPGSETGSELVVKLRYGRLEDGRFSMGSWIDGIRYWICVSTRD